MDREIQPGGTETIRLGLQTVDARVLIEWKDGHRADLLVEDFQIANTNQMQGTVPATIWEGDVEAGKTATIRLRNAGVAANTARISLLPTRKG